VLIAEAMGNNNPKVGGRKEEAYGEMNIECINEKIRAEREFKSKYKSE